jgi:hypothetical protein
MMIHYTQATLTRFAFVHGERERRTFIRELARIAGPRLLMFGLADDHQHTGLAGDTLNLLVRDLRATMRRLRPDLELAPAHVKPFEDRRHLRSTVDYLIRQPTKHELDGVHPALYSGTCFLDLVGARLLQGYEVDRLRAELPRLKDVDLLPIVGLEPRPLQLASDDDLHRVGAARIANLAAAVFAVGPGLSGRTPIVVRARTLAARLIMSLGLGAADGARYLGVNARQVQRLAHDGPHDPAGEEALRRRLTLEIRALGGAIPV